METWSARNTLVVQPIRSSVQFAKMSLLYQKKGSESTGKWALFFKKNYIWQASRNKLNKCLINLKKRLRNFRGVIWPIHNFTFKNISLKSRTRSISIEIKWYRSGFTLLVSNDLTISQEFKSIIFKLYSIWRKPSAIKLVDDNNLRQKIGKPK